MTPIRRQYLAIKRQYPDVIVFFRLGDFYETFDDDARVCAEILQITLTTRNFGRDGRVPMAGIPFHAAEGHLARLVAAGHRVAIVEQVDENAAAGLMERRVTRVVSAGTLVEERLLPSEANNFLLAVARDGDTIGLAAADVSTGECLAGALGEAQAAAEIARLQPAEVLVAQGAEPPALPRGTRITSWAAARFSALPEARDAEGEALPEVAGRALAALRDYLAASLPQVANALGPPRPLGMAGTCRVSATALRHLAVLPTPGAPRGGMTSLFDVLDLTQTPMGGRLLREWLTRPLAEPPAINRRLDSVGSLTTDGSLRSALRAGLARMGDLGRLATRVSAGLAQPRELVTLRLALHQAADALTALASHADRLPAWEPPPPIDDLLAALDSALVDDPPKGGDAVEVVRPGHSAALDEVRRLAADSRSVLAEIEARARSESGIRSLRLGYNRVFGYYLEVSHANRALVPETWTRRQTLVNAERYVTPELKEIEERILGAQARSEELAEAIVRELAGRVARQQERLRALATSVAIADVLSALAEAAARYDYRRPAVDDAARLRIVAGRHPLVERALPEGTFVPNDCLLDIEGPQIAVVTGPNMAGKSTYLRQCALIVLMAQTGSFVPAAEALIGVADRIFTRVGAQDDLVGGASTFMVEMLETAAILRDATPRSLVVLDEVGRGTSTYDGISIARAVVEYLHNHSRHAARTLFATHYHELAGLADELPRVTNLTMAVAEQDGAVVFLRQVIPGAADRSYGIHVAELAGLPRPVVERAREVLRVLEEQGRGPRRRQPVVQMRLFEPDSPLVRELRELDVDAITPLEAITRLYELRTRARAEGGPS